MELLSPAGSPETVVAAVQSGADAIYLGLEDFNARASAKNFTRREFQEAVAYCHARGCKVYVTMNTLVNDRELDALAELGDFVSRAGADAVLVQDLGAARVLRAVCPDLPLHASTQMSVHNLAGVHAAAQLGMKRVVLARELSREQIRFITLHSPVEVEVFAHGALCFCHSGQCYMSALIGRRSGNRGRCAQPCRMAYSFGRKSEVYPLSLKDNCLLPYMKELEEMGVACVKLEGRMKRPEYVAVVTEIYSKVVHDGLTPTEKDYERLRLAFSRDGFTDGYYTGDKTNMTGTRGEIDPDAERMFTEARKRYSAGEVRRVPVDFRIEVRPLRQTSLSASDDEGHTVTVRGPEPEEAQNAALTRESVQTQLYKTGGTQYKARNINGMIGDGLFLSAGSLNALRREALDALSAQRMLPPRRRSGILPPRPLANSLPTRLNLNLQVTSAAQLTPELAVCGPDNLYVPLTLLTDSPELLRPFTEKGTALAAVLPRVIADDELDEVVSRLRRAADLGVRTAVVGNLGHVALARSAGMEVRGDYGLNVFNSHTMQTLADAGLRSATASFELRFSQVRDLVKCLDTELILYGRLPCMVSDQDLVAQADAGDNPVLSDRMGSAFPVQREFGCRTVIWNAHKLFLADKMDDVLPLGLWAGRLLFTTESPRECVEVTKSYQGESKYQPNGMTRGLYYRGVE